MRHGTCSDYNQYCPNARIGKYPHSGSNQTPPLANAQSLGNLRTTSTTSTSAGGQQHPQQPELTYYTAAEREHHSVSPKTLPHSQKLSCNQQQRQYYQNYSRPNNNNQHHRSQSSVTSASAYHPLPLLEDTPASTSATVATSTPLFKGERAGGVSLSQSKPIPLIRHVLNHNTSHTCCSSSIASSAGDSATPSVFDYYQEHIYHFFYRRQISKEARQYRSFRTKAQTSPYSYSPVPSSRVCLSQGSSSNCSSGGGGGGDGARAILPGDRPVNVLPKFILLFVWMLTNAASSFQLIPKKESKLLRIKC